MGRLGREFQGGGGGAVTVRAIGSVGGGTMGQGIAITCGATGLDVALYEKTAERARASVEAIGESARPRHREVAPHRVREEGDPGPGAHGRRPRGSRRPRS
ncbi:MAG: 3-hydroxyacyl-CoA dehydrogenase NAD-binding domain-containing protein [Vicinamibacteria bacterium]